MILDATVFTDKPVPVLPGCRPCRVIYEQEIWPDAAKRGTMPDEARVRQLAVKSWWNRVPGEILCLDIEGFTTHKWKSDIPDRTIETSLDVLGRVADWMHDEVPGLRLGFYDILPTSYTGDPTAKNLALIAMADQRKLYGRDEQGRFEAEGLADKVDVTFPMLYVGPETSIDQWVGNATRAIARARRYQKQTYPFLWFYNEKTLSLLAADWWEVMLSTCKQLADGMVIWHGKAGPNPWDESAAWWQVTKKFIGLLT